VFWIVLVNFLKKLFTMLVFGNLLSEALEYVGPCIEALDTPMFQLTLK
jgi:hypothetical protein